MTLEGLLNVDKPEGLTSHDVINQIRRLSEIRRVGHAGTLDPLATGVLLVCVGRATRLVEYLVGQIKRYEATVRLGQVTDTYDAEGELLQERPVQVSRQEVVAALVPFRGRIRQKAPVYSAIKRGGKPLYELARAGARVERPEREVEIYKLELVAWQPPHLGLRVACSAGTYIRSLAHDLGEALGCGGHISALRRTAVGAFAVECAVPLADLARDGWQQHLQPSDAAVRHLPGMQLNGSEVRRLWLGQPVPFQATHPDVAQARAYGEDGAFIGMVMRQADRWQPHKMFLPA